MNKIYYGGADYNLKKINTVIKVLRNSSLSLTNGKKVTELEKDF